MEGECLRREEYFHANFYVIIYSHVRDARLYAKKSNILIRSATPMKERRRDTNSYHAANKSGLRLPESILSRINDKIYETPKVGQHPLLPRSRESPLREDKAR